MNAYLARIEIHQGSESDYTALHKELETKAFERTIESDGKVYDLPSGTYRRESWLSAAQIRDSAKDAVSKIGKKGGIIVVTYSDGALDGLNLHK